jgi:hypothetical protein
MAITLNGDTGITTPTYGGTVAAEYIAPVTSFKNRIINGAMQIDQRNAGAAVTQTTTGLDYPLDRFIISGTVTSKFTGQRSTVAPAGFVNSLLCTSLSSYSVGSSETFVITQRIEGFNIADLGWGTANASPVTLSFWTRSSLTGTFGGSIRNGATNRSYPFSYTISAANTWEYKTVTIAGDTTGTWVTDNGRALVLSFSLGTGSTLSGTAGAWSASNFLSATGATSVVGTNGATFYITGVQLEKGSTATSFDYRPYPTELQLCQRYFELLGSGFGRCASSSSFDIVFPYKIEKRANPSVALVNGTNAITQLGIPGSTISSIASNWATSTVSIGVGLNAGAGLTTGSVATTVSVPNVISVSAEL